MAKFQLHYYKTGNETPTIEDREFINIAACKRWYKKEYDTGNMEFSTLQIFDYQNQRVTHYKIRFTNKEKQQ